MKVFVEITGQIDGNFKLKNKIQNHEGSNKTESTMFNGFRIYFDTKTQAKNALKQAYKSLVDDYPDMKDRICGVSLFDEMLMYDASKATIIKDETF